MAYSDWFVRCGTRDDLMYRVNDPGAVCPCCGEVIGPGNPVSHVLYKFMDVHVKERRYIVGKKEEEA